MAGGIFRPQGSWQGQGQSAPTCQLLPPAALAAPGLRAAGTRVPSSRASGAVRWAQRAGWRGAWLGGFCCGLRRPSSR
eukprot:1850688-Alexandrium_andersonii.AAC.1